MRILNYLLISFILVKGFQSIRIGCPTSGFKKELCYWLIQNNPYQDLELYSGGTATEAHNKWCYSSAQRTHWHIDIFVNTHFSSGYSPSDTRMLNSMVTQSLTKYIETKVNEVWGSTLTVMVWLNARNYDVLYYNFVEDSALITKIQGYFGRRAPFNSEMFIDQGIIYYCPIDHIRDSSKYGDIQEGIMHELGHSIMDMRGVLWSMRHKGTSDLSQNPLPNIPSDDDILTYSPHPNPTKLLNLDRLWFLLSCDDNESGYSSMILLKNNKDTSKNKHKSETEVDDKYNKVRKVFFGKKKLSKLLIRTKGEYLKQFGVKKL
jgi:hypothetical protein